MIKSIIRALGLVLILVSCTSCQTPARSVSGRSYLLESVGKRIFLIVQAEEIDALAVKDGVFRFSGSFGKEAYYGSATPITPDGYLLTNAHVVENPDGTHVFWWVQLSPNAPEFGRLEVVWEDSEADVAVVKVGKMTPDYYRWSEVEGYLPRGFPLVQTGLRTFLQEGKVWWGGKLDRFSPSYQRIHTSVPVRRGDSGSAVVDEDGRLVALNSQWRLYGSRLVRPNPDRIDFVIESHRKQASPTIP